MRKYDSYKDSGIEWVGQIPENWNVNALKRVVKIKITDGPHETPTFIDEGVPFISAEAIKDSRIDFNYCRGYISKDLDNLYSKKCKPKVEDIFIVKSGSTTGKIAIVEEQKDFNIWSPLALVRLQNFYHPKYFYYLLQSTIFQDQVKVFWSFGTQPNIGMNVLERLFICFPTKNEQTAIAQYLDSKTKAIDKKANLLEKKIGYYKELRKSIINETVTKGLDKSAALQENDLGFETPSTWSKKRLKDLGFLYSGLSGKSGDDFNQDDNPNNKGFIPFTNIANNTYLKKDHLGTVVVFDGEKQNKVKEGDIFFLMSSEGYEDIGKSAVLAENIDDTYLNSFCKGFRIKQKHCNPYFLNYLLLSDYYRQILIVEGKGFTRINLKMEKVNDFEVYLPKNLNEQSDIVSYLDHKTQTIDKIVGNIQNQITTLKELRKTLINDVVTGKIKVVE
ncbi:restriction endonuclease subunit S [Mariniflexile maritimum]|uniref:restriction endonuclease subunit S n=1 Tax=Mariniflexile maritimum TaxID=2682493 RepID=UPI0012F64DAA|nr:restriction endonuclease subunit S [Mariniflexile maritimum]